VPEGLLSQLRVWPLYVSHSSSSTLSFARNTLRMLCPSGTFAMNPGSLTCASCPDGTTSPIGSSTCTYIPPPSPVQNLAVSTRASVSLPSADVAALSQPRDESSGTQVTVLCPSGAFFIADAPLPKVQAGCAMFAICPHPACPSVLCAGLTTLLIPKGAPACLVHQARLQPSEIQVRLIKPCCYHTAAASS
jgi:hypothetical protein